MTDIVIGVGRADLKLPLLRLRTASVRFCRDTLHRRYSLSGGLVRHFVSRTFQPVKFAAAIVAPPRAFNAAGRKH
jgi:hypothetical protein